MTKPFPNFPLLPLLASVLLAAAVPARAQRNYPPTIEGAAEHVYKSVGEGEEAADLKLWAFYPKDDRAEPWPAIVFFFGGGWKAGSPEQFVPHCRHLARRGMIAVAADYRVSSRHGVKAADCVEDARDAMRFLHREAGRLGIDPERIAAGGGSAGGHLAACLGTLSSGDPEVRPELMALFNPAVVLAPLDGKNPWPKDRSEELRERMGTDPEALSPAHHVSADTPPAILFHGMADTAVPYATAEAFATKMAKVGVPCELKGYEGAGHGFFNASRKHEGDGPSPYERTLEQLDRFLVERGWLRAKE